MQILIIAGGEAKRMRPLTTHKSLYPFLGKLFLEHILANFPADHFPSPILVTSPSRQQELTQLLGKQVQVMVQAKPLGMADAVLSASSALKPSEPLLITSAGKFQHPSTYQTMLKSIKSSPDTPLLAARQVKKYKHGGYLVLDGDRVTSIVEKPGPDHMPSPHYKINLDYFPVAEDFLSALKLAHSDKDDLYEVGLNSFLSDHPTKLVTIEADHASLKYPHHLLEVADLFLRHNLVPGIHPSAQVHPSVVIEGDVQVDEGARVLAHTTIIGPTYIGRDTLIGQNTLVRNSMIEEGSKIGFGSEIARSYLGPGTKGHMIYVGDSITEGPANLSAGTILANRRFDNQPVSLSLPSGRVNTDRRKLGAVLAKNVTTGVNSSLMPGTVAEPGATTPPNSSLKGYVRASRE